LLSSGVYLGTLAALAAAHHLSAGLALAAYLSGIALATIWTLARLRPRFRGASAYLRTTLRQAREYGMNLYFARITGIASSRADQLVIAFFLIDSAPLGIYAIIQKFANPLTMLGRTVAVTRFRAFAQMKRIPTRITVWSTLILCTLAVGLIGIGPIVIRFL